MIGNSTPNQATNYDVQKLQEKINTGKPPQELPSITGFLKQKKVLIPTVVFLVLLGVLLICALSSGGGNGNGGQVVPTSVLNNITPTPALSSPTPARVNPNPVSELQRCFNECTRDQLAQQLETQVKLVNHYKGLIIEEDLQETVCTHDLVYYNAPGSFQSYPLTNANCEGEIVLDTNFPVIQIANKRYIQNPTRNWDISTVTPLGRLPLVDIAETVKLSQELEVERIELEGKPLLKLTGKSEKVNVVNKLVETSITVVFDEFFHVTSYTEIENENFRRVVEVFAYEEENIIQAPR